jgi:hypothetical protein
MKICQLAYALAILVCTVTSAVATPFPPLTQQGSILLSVCAPRQLQKLKTSFIRYKLVDEENAWKAVTVLLYGRTTVENTRYIKNTSSAKLDKTSDSTGQDNQSEIIETSDEAIMSLFASGIAYDVEVAVTPGMFRILYYSSEVCIQSRTFKYVSQRWMITGMGEACD